MMTPKKPYSARIVIALRTMQIRQQRKQQRAIVQHLGMVLQWLEARPQKARVS